MPKTLLITAFYPPLLGGLEHYWNEVARRWPKNELVVLTQPIRNGSGFVERLDATVIREPFFPLRRFRPSWLPLVNTIARISAKHKIDRLLFGHFANYALAGPFLKKLKGMPYDIITHGVDSVLPMRSRFGAWTMRRVLNNADTLYANSLQTSRYLQTISQRPVRVAPPGIDFSDYPEQSKAEARQQTGWESKFVILFVGRLVAVKGVDILLQAVSKLPRSMDFELVIVGTGPEKSALIDLSAALNIKDRVSFIGQIPDDPSRKSAWYAGADVFVLPSRPIQGHRESFGSVCLEAARYGLPVILTDSCGAQEVVKNEQTGRLVKSNDPDALRLAIQSVWENPEGAKALGQALANLVHEKYTWNATVRTLAHLDD